jgi:predicted N-formylglutamate amidohydrolase
MDLGKTHFSALDTSSNILFTCEHATGRIPEHLNNLGLTETDLANCKDQYDPGALDLAKELAARFKASLVWTDLSRLVIDANRHFDAPGKDRNSFHSCLLKKELLVERDGKDVLIAIPHNQTLGEKEERELYETVCVPYQNEMLQMVEDLKRNHEHVYVISVHSFFPMYNGNIRTVDIDVMGYIHPEVTTPLRDEIRKNAPYNTEIDTPWSLRDVDGGAFHALRDEEDTTVFAFDVKNDNLQSAADISKMAAALEVGITSVRK